MRENHSTEEQPAEGMKPPLSFIIPSTVTEERADKLLAAVLPGNPSRSYLARLMRLGLVLRDRERIIPSTVLHPGDRVEILPVPEDKSETSEIAAPAVPVIYEDEDLIVVDKPAGLVVHPGAGRSSGTLMDLLVRTRPEMIGVGEPNRWGIVHRLDRDTSGVMVVAKTGLAHATLSVQFKEHSVHRIYLALVRGSPREEEGVIDASLGRHVRDRKRISTVARKARAAITEWRVLERLDEFTLLEVRPQTGRTHQIRVHLASRGLPVAGDQVYGKIRKTRSRGMARQRSVSALLRRQALHASVLGFIHPRDRTYREFSSPLPEDMAEAVRVCREAGALEKG